MERTVSSTLYDCVTVENFSDFAGEFKSTKFKFYMSLLILPEQKKDEEQWKPIIDTLMKHPEVDKLSITGLSQQSFEYLIKQYGSQLKALNINASQRIEDFSLLSTLTELEFFSVFWNQRVDRLWDMENNLALKGICLYDFTRLKSLSGIEKAPALVWFNYGDIVDSRATIESYKLFADTSVEYLIFSGKKIEDDDLSFLENMPSLKEFNFPTNHYSTEKVAWIVANFPNLKGYALKSMIEFDVREGKEVWQEVLIIGKRKPYLKVYGNEDRIKRYDDKFNSLVEGYRGMSYEQAFG